MSVEDALPGPEDPPELKRPWGGLVWSAVTLVLAGGAMYRREWWEGIAWLCATSCQFELWYRTFERAQLARYEWGYHRMNALAGRMSAGWKDAMQGQTKAEADLVAARCRIAELEALMGLASTVGSVANDPR